MPKSVSTLINIAIWIPGHRRLGPQRKPPEDMLTCQGNTGLVGVWEDTLRFDVKLSPLERGPLSNSVRKGSQQSQFPPLLKSANIPYEKRSLTLVNPCNNETLSKHTL